MAKGDPIEVFTITDAQRPLSVEQAARTRRYLVSMGIRTVCVIAAIFIPGWPRALFIAGAIGLPYIAVVVANAGRENDEPGQAVVTPPVRPELPTSGVAIDPTIPNADHRTTAA